MLTSKPAADEYGKYENVKCALNDRELIKIALQIASGMQHLESKKVWRCLRNISKTSARFHQVSKSEKHLNCLKPRGLRPSGFIVFERLET